MLGSHRAGTSVTARVLNLLGVDLGPAESLLKAAPRINKKGFWEHHELMRVGARTLRSFGGTWAEPPALAAGWERSPELDELRARAAQIVQEDFGDASLWGWKDPRSSLTLPFWEALLGPMTYVICLRNPLDVALSLERRDGFPPEKGVDLWLLYTASAIVNTAGKPRTFAFYEDYFADPERQLARLAAFVGNPERVDDSEVRALVSEWLDPALRHHHTSLAETLASDVVAVEAKSLLLALELAYRSDHAEGVSADPQRERAFGEGIDALARAALEARPHGKQQTRSSMRA